MNKSSLIGLNLSISVWLTSVLFPGVPMLGQQETVNANPVVHARTQKPSNAPLSDTGLTSVPEDFAKLRLIPGMLLHFGVFGAQEMDATLRVGSDGSVLVPLAGTVVVENLSVTEARAKIRTALVEGEYFNDPQVNLDIVQTVPGYITVLGEVQTPGRIQVFSPVTLQMALAMAGGETVEASDDIEIQHQQADRPVEHIRNDKDSTKNSFDSIQVQRGDTIRVHRAGIVYVLGSVHRPGGYIMLNRGKLNLLEALSLAGGTALDASTGSIRILHQGNDKVAEEKVKLSDYTDHAQLAPTLRDNDIVYVPTSKPRAILVNGATIIGAAASSLLYRIP